MNRPEMLQRLDADEDVWDIAIIGGGATGLSCAHDAALRGYSTVLIEQHDFAKGTSSRSTKLIHGGVRYLAQGNVSLVKEALHERTRLFKNAADWVKPLAFILPAYRFWEPAYYGVGLWMYDRLARESGRYSSKLLSAKMIRRHMPGLRTSGLNGGNLYYDGQFDDTRLAIALARTAVSNGATVLNYVAARSLIKESKRVAGVVAEDVLTGKTYRIRARAVINATGVFVDKIRQLDFRSSKPVVSPSQGIHLVLKREFLNSTYAMLIPSTDDGRVLFAIPWHGHLLIGTTDVKQDQASLEPAPSDQEIDYLLEHLGRYLERKPTRQDVLSTFAGLRPLVRPPKGADSTAAISRDHSILISKSGLVTVTGGKWTTCRKMGEDTINRAAETGGLKPAPCRTADFRLLPDAARPIGEMLHPALEYDFGDVDRAVTDESAQTLEDVLARRTRCLFLNAAAAQEVAPAVARQMATLLGRDASWAAEQVAAFETVAANYRLMVR